MWVQLDVRIRKVPSHVYERFRHSGFLPSRVGLLNLRGALRSPTPTSSSTRRWTTIEIIGLVDIDARVVGAASGDHLRSSAECYPARWSSVATLPPQGKQLPLFA